MISRTMNCLIQLLAALSLILVLPSCGRSGASDNYPLDVCVVSGEKLGSMGKPHVIVHDGVEVRFCCAHCLPKFEANPAEYMAKIKAAH